MLYQIKQDQLSLEYHGNLIARYQDKVKTLEEKVKEMNHLLNVYREKLLINNGTLKNV